MKSSTSAEHLTHMIDAFEALCPVSNPPEGWIRAQRTVLGLSLRELGTRLAITKQSVSDIEKREKEGSITLKALREAAHALDMELIYGIVPRETKV